ncbi:protein-L-isoaspartate(D-aspartate) O-methyltransferase [Arenibacter certesii]|uniref:Protein-L-isoaspartate O-methyltransferase n=1 Tax=Arenibacter certesii TaxID=228955 RepID=A0A918ILY6_9FLAO|nr:protein-L-isoaspartate(D-aspartate) O-methyltransferase [Arenibacter certesii]GGW21679.1 protein-L-isoaspartate O-methyltransferase [Arenibacter certesii]
MAQVNWATERKNMVNNQLIARGINDPATLEAMKKVPRHKFVPHSLIKQAYNDHALPIGNDQTISQPYIVAFMTESLDLNSTDNVLEIGTGSGYQAAVMAEIVASVYTIEIVKDLANSAKNRLDTLEYNNVSVKWGDGYHGWPEQAPFDAIMVTAGAEEVPEPLISQLKDGGRMVIPVDDKDGGTYLIKLTKQDGKLKKEILAPVRFVPFTRDKRNH